MSAGSTYTWIHRVWYDDAAFGWLLLPFGGLYRLVLAVRRMLYRAGIFSTRAVAAPVVVVGNITAGGTGKTPTVLWLVHALLARGFKPGIVSRGYGGSRSDASLRVRPDSDPAIAGDEPVLLARRASSPVVVDRDRARGAALLVDEGADVIIADDGLQHYRLHRDMEICVVDGERGLGNRRMLPAGPLREPAARLATVDQVLVNGPASPGAGEALPADAITFELTASEACRLDGTLARPLERFADATVHAVAAIGNPARFFAMLRGQGIRVIEHGFPDHAALRPEDLDFDDEFPVFMTEKDAVKFDSQGSDRFWYVPVEMRIENTAAERWLAGIETRLRTWEPVA